MLCETCTTIRNQLKLNDEQTIFIQKQLIEFGCAVMMDSKVREDILKINDEQYKNTKQ